MPKLLTEELVTGDTIHEWTINEYESHDRGWKWFFLVGVGCVLLIGYAILVDNFLFALIIILGVIILYLQHHQDPEQVLFQITELGVVVGKKFYPYRELTDFYIIYQPPRVKSLFIGTKSATRPTIRIPLYDRNPVEVRHILLEHLDEDIEKEEEPISESIVRFWKMH
jgi:hypothetical protein